jgi:alcohol dehydrogenase class IV
VAALFKLLEIVGIPCRLSDYGATKADIPELTEGGMKISRLFVPNPRNMTEEDVKNIYTKAL